MKQTKGKANPQMLNKMFIEEIKESPRKEFSMRGYYLLIHIQLLYINSPIISIFSTIKGSDTNYKASFLF